MSGIEQGIIFGKRMLHSKNPEKSMVSAQKYSKLKTAITPSVFMRFYPTKAQNVRNLAENLLGKSKQKAKTQKN